MQVQGFSHPAIVVAASVKMIDSAGLSASNMHACISVLQWNIPSDRAWAGLKCFFKMCGLCRQFHSKFLSVPWCCCVCYLTFLIPFFLLTYAQVIN